MNVRLQGPISVLILIATLAVPAYGTDLTGASFDAPRDRVITIPKTGNAQIVIALRANFRVAGATCSTGSLATYWTPVSPAPKGITVGFDQSAMRSPSSVRGVAFNVYPTAQPMALRPFTVVVPRGNCGGSNQTAVVWIALEAAK